MSAGEQKRRADDIGENVCVTWDVPPSQDYQRADASGATWAEREYERHDIGLYYGERT